MRKIVLAALLIFIVGIGVLVAHIGYTNQPVKTKRVVTCGTVVKETPESVILPVK